MTEKGKQYANNKRVLRHKAQGVGLGVQGAQMSVHPTISSRGRANIKMGKTPVSNGFLNTDLGLDNLQNDTPEADL